MLRKVSYSLSYECKLGISLLITISRYKRVEEGRRYSAMGGSEAKARKLPYRLVSNLPCQYLITILEVI